MKERLLRILSDEELPGARRLRMVQRAMATFSDNRAAQAAAALAYYALFSLFPLLLVVIAGGSFFLDNQRVSQEVLGLVQKVIPVSGQLLAENLRRVLEARSAVGIVGFLALLWSASGFFTNLAYNINLAWPQAPRRNFLEKRLVGIGMIAGLSGLLVLSLILEWVTRFVPILEALASPVPTSGLVNLISVLSSWLAILALFLALYRWVPTLEVPWRAAFPGALVAAFGWKAVTAGFAWYLRSGLGRYQLVYGSLGAVVALLVMLYAIAMLALFGAHLCAAIDHKESEATPRTIQA